MTVRYQQPDDNSRGKSPAPFEAAGSSSSEGRGGGSGEGDGGAFGSSRADTDAWTQHFHEGFTQQAISLSILEDAASVSSSTAPSNLNSDDEGDAELYPGFEFVSQPLLYSEEKLRKLDQEAQNRVRALQKRRMLKNKKDEEKATKVATDTAENARLKLKAEAKQRADIEAKRIAQETLAWEIKEREERQRIEKILADHTKQVKLFEEACLEHTAKLEAVRKQTRAIKKKLRDIAQLEEKIAGSTSKITPEQKEKLAAKTELEQRVSDLEYEEEDLMQSPPVAPAPLPSELIAAGTPSIVEDPNSTPNDTNISTSTSVEAASSSGISLVPKESSLETTSKAEVISSPIISTESKASEQPATPATSTISTSIAATALSNEDNNKDKKEAENGKAKSPPPEDEWVDVKTVKSAKKKDRK